MRRPRRPLWGLNHPPGTARDVHLLVRGTRSPSPLSSGPPPLGGVTPGLPGQCNGTAARLSSVRGRTLVLQPLWGVAAQAGKAPRYAVAPTDSGARHEDIRIAARGQRAVSERLHQQQQSASPRAHHGRGAAGRSHHRRLPGRLEATLRLSRTKSHVQRANPARTAHEPGRRAPGSPRTLQSWQLYP